MTIYTAIMTYIIVAWLVFFLILPIRNQFSKDSKVQGHVASAPNRSYLRIKIVASCATSAVITWLIFLWVG